MDCRDQPASHKARMRDSEVDLSKDWIKATSSVGRWGIFTYLEYSILKVAYSIFFIVRQHRFTEPLRFLTLGCETAVLIFQPFANRSGLFLLCVWLSPLGFFVTRFKQCFMFFIFLWLLG
jgi:hypothetical protein